MLFSTLAAPAQFQPAAETSSPLDKVHPLVPVYPGAAFEKLKTAAPSHFISQILKLSKLNPVAPVPL
jgi:hypothetical protein